MLPGSPAAPRRLPPPPAASQRRELPIFQARGPLLSQLRGLECAVLIGERPGREGGGAEVTAVRYRCVR